MNVKLYEELGSLSLFTLYLYKSPVLRNQRYYLLSLSFNIGMSIGLYAVSKSLIRGSLEPRFVSENPLMGKLAEKYNFTMQDMERVEHTEEEPILNTM